MAILIYIDAQKEVVLARIDASPRRLTEIGRWPAHNDVAKKAKGPWPAGIYKFSHYNAHAEAGLLPAASTTAYGGTGIYVFSVVGRSGMGVHAGRSTDYASPGGVTLGCIRVPTIAMMKIGEVHKADPISHISVVRRAAHEALGAQSSR